MYTAVVRARDCVCVSVCAGVCACTSVLNFVIWLFYSVLLSFLHLFLILTVFLNLTCIPIPIRIPKPISLNLFTKPVYLTATEYDIVSSIHHWAERRRTKGKRHTRNVLRKVEYIVRAIKLKNMFGVWFIQTFLTYRLVILLSFSLSFMYSCIHVFMYMNLTRRHFPLPHLFYPTLHLPLHLYTPAYTLLFLSAPPPSRRSTPLFTSLYTLLHYIPLYPSTPLCTTPRTLYTSLHSSYYALRLSILLPRQFNRGLLLNIGYELAKKQGFNVFIFHDVDLLPQPKLLSWYAHLYVHLLI